MALKNLAIIQLCLAFMFSDLIGGKGKTVDIDEINPDGPSLFNRKLPSPQTRPEIQHSSDFIHEGRPSQQTEGQSETARTVALSNKIAELKALREKLTSQLGSTEQPSNPPRDKTFDDGSNSDLVAHPLIKRSSQRPKTSTIATQTDEDGMPQSSKFSSMRGLPISENSFDQESFWDSDQATSLRHRKAIEQAKGLGLDQEPSEPMLVREIPESLPITTETKKFEPASLADLPGLRKPPTEFEFGALQRTMSGSSKSSDSDTDSLITPRSSISSSSQETKKSRKTTKSSLRPKNQKPADPTMNLEVSFLNKFRSIYNSPENPNLDFKSFQRAVKVLEATTPEAKDQAIKDFVQNRPAVIMAKTELRGTLNSIINYNKNKLNQKELDFIGSDIKIDDLGNKEYRDRVIGIFQSKLPANDMDLELLLKQREYLNGQETKEVENLKSILKTTEGAEPEVIKDAIINMQRKSSQRGENYGLETTPQGKNQKKAARSEKPKSPSSSREQEDGTPMNISTPRSLILQGSFSDEDA